MSRIPLLVYPAVGWALFVDIPTRLSLGPLSASGAATLGIALLSLYALPLLILEKDRVSGAPLALGLFVAWSLLWLAFNASSEGVQNVAVYSIFVAGVTFASRCPPERIPDVRRWFTRVAWVVATLGILDGLAPDSFSLYDDRAFALTTLVLLAVVIPEPSGRLGPLLPSLLALGVLLSLSRTALVLVGLMLPFLVLRRPEANRTVRIAALYLLVLMGMWGLISRYEPLRDRFMTGDNYAIGGVAFNTSGRSVIWSSVRKSMESGDQLLGQGPGSATEFLISRFLNISHPHNDYLRLWHDLGLIGLALFVTGYAVLMWRTLRRAGRDRRSVNSPSHWSAFLGLAAIGLAALTDNVMVYPFVMLPLGVVVGLSQAAHAAQTTPPSSYAVRRIPEFPDMPQGRDMAHASNRVRSR